MHVKLNFAYKSSMFYHPEVCNGYLKTADSNYANKDAPIMTSPLRMKTMVRCARKFRARVYMFLEGHMHYMK